MSDYEKYLESATLELRRGTLVLSVLSVLEKPMYGYSLVQTLAKRGLLIDQSTLYPLLRRLEKQEFLTSDWEVEDNRPRKYYKVSNLGEKFIKDLQYEWEKNISIVEKLTSKGEK